MGDITMQSTRRAMLRVSVDGWDGIKFFGRIYSPLKGEIPFDGIIQMMMALEAYYDWVKFPQRAFERRSFCNQRRPGMRGRKPAVVPSVRSEMELWEGAVMPEGGAPRLGACVSFDVHVLFRRNASWQGRITWIEGEKMREFASFLELLQLMRLALGAGGRARLSWSWASCEL